MSLEELKKKIQKNVKGVHVDVLSQSNIASVDNYVPTPHYDLNRIISGSIFKGLPEKTLSLLVGPEASFKSSFMCLTMANAQELGYTPVIIDTEGAWTPEFVSNWGLDPDNILYTYAPFIDETLGVIGSLIDSGEKFFIGLDSIGNLETEKFHGELKDGEKGKADQGQLQKSIKRMLKILLAVIKKQKSIGVISGHYYGNPSQYGNAQEIGGGYHMRLAPHIIISLKKSKILGNDKEVIGSRIKAITLKDRFYPAFNECNVDIDYQNGINIFSGLADIAIDAGLITKGGAWYTSTVTGEKVQGSAKLGELLTDDMLHTLDEHIRKTGYSTVNREMEATMKEMEEAGKEENEFLEGEK